MYKEALRDIIKDIVAMCGESLENEDASKELLIIEEEIKDLELIKDTPNYDESAMDVLKVRKEHWENSASYLGREILSGFENKENKHKLIEMFNILYQKANDSYKELNILINNGKTNNIWDLINNKKMDLIKLKARNVNSIKNNSYSNVVNHYNSKRNLIENVISSLKEKKILTSETITMYSKIIEDIKEEIKNNAEKLNEYEEMKIKMACSLYKEREYAIIDEEIEKLVEIKKFNESQLKLFNYELETIIEETEAINSEIENKEEELERTLNQLESFKKALNNGEYVSKEQIIEHEYELKESSKELDKLELQKNLLYINLDKMKDMALDILNKNDEETEKVIVNNTYDEDKANEIEELINMLGLSREEAIKTVEISSQRDKEDDEVNKYMDEFDLSLEEAKEALSKETNHTFWRD